MPLMNGSTEILAHIQNEQDRRILVALMERNEVLRVRLSAHPSRTRSEQEAIDYFRQRLAEWEAWGKRSTAQNQRLIDRNRELTAKIAELEEQLHEIVRKIEPHNRRLFQG